MTGIIQLQINKTLSEYYYRTYNYADKYVFKSLESATFSYGLWHKSIHTKYQLKQSFYIYINALIKQRVQKNNKKKNKLKIDRCISFFLFVFKTYEINIFLRKW